MSETGPPKGMQAPNTGTQDAVLAKKAQEARGSSKVDEILAATGAMGQAISTEAVSYTHLTLPTTPYV